MSINKQKINKILNILMIILIVIQPLLDVSKSLFGDVVQIFNFSFLEIINITLVMLVFTLSFIVLDNDKKKKTCVVFIIYLVYLFLHYLNMTRFKNTTFNYNELSFLKETYYILRAYIQPLVILACIYINDLDKKYFYLAIKILIGIISIIMIVTNLFNIAFLSYKVDNVKITHNIFSWFNFNGVDFNLLKSKGWFYSANQLSNLLFILLPIMIYLSYIENKRVNYLLLFVHLISMFMLGTKTATLGAAGLCVGSSIILLMYNFIKKDKKSLKNGIKVIITFIVAVPLFLFSPLVMGKINKVKIEQNSIIDDSGKQSLNSEILGNGNKFNIREDINLEKYEKAYNLIISDTSCESFNQEETNILIDYMNKNYYFHRINKLFIEEYPIEVDFEFWCNNYRRNSHKNNDSRVIKTEILSRIIEKNKNVNDLFYGLGYSLGFMEIERDYYQQYYWFGIWGLVLLVVPYLMIFVSSCWNVLINLKSKFTLENIFFLISIFFGLVIAYFSGHFFGKLFIMLIYSCIVAIGCKNIRRD